MFPSNFFCLLILVLFVCFIFLLSGLQKAGMKGNTLQFYNRLTGGFVRLHPDSTVDAVGEKTDKYGKIMGLACDAMAVLGAGGKQVSLRDRV